MNMRKTLTALTFGILVSCTATVFGQTNATAPAPTPMAMDTLITIKNEKIPCKVTKISDYEIEYKKVNDPEATVFTTAREKVKEIRWSNGKKELLMPDEMDVNLERQILDKRSAIKFHFFSPIASQLTFSYEHCLKVGTNIEFSAGLINNSILYNSSSPNLIQGLLFSGGVKFLLGEDFYVAGLKYAHPLKGRFIKPEIDFSSFVIRGETMNTGSTYNNGYYTPGPIYVTDQRITSAALIINYGRQFVLGNILTFGYSVGLGYAFTSSKYTNASYPNGSYPGMSTFYLNNGDLYSHYIFSTNVPIAIKGEITVGYIFK
jgi:hypothetical protein